MSKINSKKNDNFINKITQEQITKKREEEAFQALRDFAKCKKGGRWITNPYDYLQKAEKLICMTNEEYINEYY